MPDENKIVLITSLDTNKKVIKVDGEGAAEITFSTDATQLADVLRAMTKFTGKRITMTLEPDLSEQDNGEHEPIHKRVGRFKG